MWTPLDYVIETLIIGTFIFGSFIVAFDPWQGSQDNKPHSTPSWSDDN